MKFFSQNLNHPFLPSVNNVLVIEITPTKALFACFNINQNDKNLHISFCAECFIILYRSREYESEMCYACCEYVPDHILSKLWILIDIINLMLDYRCESFNSCWMHEEAYFFHVEEKKRGNVYVSLCWRHDTRRSEELCLISSKPSKH